ncbi:DUF5376 family protein [Mannheimia granulomatis]|nr:DUF5376 family protein [Mannheimia granulomatis]
MMKLLFSYFNDKNTLYPMCELAENHRLNPLTGYLNDPMGGINYFAFLDSSLSILRDRTINNADISSNSWGVEIENEIVHIHFLFAPDVDELRLTMPRNIFIDILVVWLIFCSKEKVLGYQEYLEFKV